MKYAEKLKDPRWQMRRWEILERDDYTCQRCLETDGVLNVHHIRYTPRCEPWDSPDDDLITLCENCHYSIDHSVPENEIRNPWLVYERRKKELPLLNDHEYQSVIGKLCLELWV